MDNNNTPEAFNLRTFVSAIFRHTTAIILTFILGIAITYTVTLMKTPKYQATVKMHIKGVQSVDTDFYRGLGARRIHFTQMAIVNSHPVLSRTVRALRLHKRPIDYEKKFCHPIKHFLIDFNMKRVNTKLKTFSAGKKVDIIFKIALDRLRKNLETNLIPGTDIFVISVKDYTPEGAMAIANVISRSYGLFDQQQQMAELLQRYGSMHPVVQQLRDNIYSIARNLSGKRLPDIEAIGTASVKIIEQATSTYEPVGTPKAKMFLIGLLVSFCAGIGLAFLLDLIDKTFRSPVDITKTLSLPLIGSIPKKNIFEKQLLLNNKKDTRYVNFYKELTDQLFVFMKVQNLKSIAITFALNTKKNSIITSNIGYGLSHYMDQKTLIVDADFRNPSIHNVFKLPEGPGLYNLLSGDKEVETIIISDNLHLLPAGNISQNPVLMLNKFKVSWLQRMLKEKYDVIIINCPDLKRYKDAVVLSPHIDGMMLVVHEGKDYREVVRNLLVPFNHDRSKMIGAILSDRTFVIPKAIYKRL